MVGMLPTGTPRSEARAALPFAHPWESCGDLWEGHSSSRKQGIRDLSKVTRSSQTKVLLEEEANASSSFSPGLFFCRQLMLHGCNGGKYEGAVSLYGPSF